MPAAVQTPDSLTPEFLTVAEVAALLRVHPRTILNRIRDGRLPAKRLQGGKTGLIARADALALLQDVPPAPHIAPEHAAPSPAIDRLSTPAGRARALAVLDALLEGDLDEQRRAAEALNHVTPLSLRRWSPDSDTPENGDAHGDVA